MHNSSRARENSPPGQKNVAQNSVLDDFSGSDRSEAAKARPDFRVRNRLAEFSPRLQAKIVTDRNYGASAFTPNRVSKLRRARGAHQKAPASMRRNSHQPNGLLARGAPKSTGYAP